MHQKDFYKAMFSVPFIVTGVEDLNPILRPKLLLHKKHLVSPLNHNNLIFVICTR